MAAIHWFRHELRLHDNPALLSALEGTTEVYPLFIMDGLVAGTKDAGHLRQKFLWECLHDLDQKLEGHGLRLFVQQGQPVDVLQALFTKWNVKKLTFAADTEPVWFGRDNAVKKLCRQMNVECVEVNSHTLWDPQDLVDANGGQPPHTYNLFLQVSAVLGPPSRPVPDPDFSSIEMDMSANYDEESFALPSLKEFAGAAENTIQEDTPWQGGETKALSLFEIRMEGEEAAFKEGKVLPNQLKPDLNGASTSMSPHLRFGCLSIRLFYWTLHDLYQKICGNGPQRDPTCQLIWREYFHCMSYNNINFTQMKDNPICLQIDWYDNPEQLEKWTMGETGYPWIDACMNQLRNEGWIHHVGRHAVACFLTRGDLWISWEDGLKVFYKYLIDADYSICAGSWMWVSSSAFENCLQCPVCYSPVFFGMNMDPTGEFVRQHVPVLKNMPLKYLFQPWKAPLSIQQEAGCIVGKDYPERMVDHLTASRECRARMEGVKAIFKDPSLYHVTPSSQAETQLSTFLSPHKCKADLSCCDKLDMDDDDDCLFGDQRAESGD